MQIKCHDYIDQRTVSCDQNLKLIHVLPGETVFYQGEKKISEKDVITPSEHRKKAKCPIFDTCGGCDYLHIKPEYQYQLKKEDVEKTYKKEGFNPNVMNIGPSDFIFHYRHKVVASAKQIKQKLRLGLYKENSREVVPFLSCFIQDKVLNLILKTVEETLNLYKIPAYQSETNQGIIKHIFLRKSHARQDVLLCFVTQGHLLPNHKKIITDIVKKHPMIRTVYQNIHRKKTHLVLLDEEKLLYGPGYIYDEINKISFRLSLKSFYQINPAEMMRLYDKAILLADIKSTDKVMDCYSGIGTLSLLISQKAAHVTAIEVNPKAHMDALNNKKANKINNVSFHCDDVENFILNYNDHIDVLFLDPTREGATEKFLDAVMVLNPKRIVYISCEPKTQARDLKILSKNYVFNDIHLFDMFPQTTHVESVILLHKK